MPELIQDDEGAFPPEDCGGVYEFEGKPAGPVDLVELARKFDRTPAARRH